VGLQARRGAEVVDEGAEVVRLVHRREQRGLRGPLAQRGEVALQHRQRQHDVVAGVGEVLPQRALTGVASGELAPDLAGGGGEGSAQVADLVAGRIERHAGAGEPGGGGGLDLRGQAADAPHHRADRQHDHGQHRATSGSSQIGLAGSSAPRKPGVVVPRVTMMAHGPAGQSVRTATVTSAAKVDGATATQSRLASAARTEAGSGGAAGSTADRSPAWAWNRGGAPRGPSGGGRGGPSSRSGPRGPSSSGPGPSPTGPGPRDPGPCGPGPCRCGPRLQPTGSASHRARAPGSSRRARVMRTSASSAARWRLRASSQIRPITIGTATATVATTRRARSLTPSSPSAPPRSPCADPGAGTLRRSYAAPTGARVPPHGRACPGGSSRPELDQVRQPGPAGRRHGTTTNSRFIRLIRFWAASRSVPG
jgi:hypothetical protein